MKKGIVIVFVLLVGLICCLCTGCTKEVTNKSTTINFQSVDYSGLYTGVCVSDIPQGEGEFSYKKDDQYLKYKGTFNEGSFSEKGTLETNFYKFKYADIERVGEYKGDVVDGIPNGHGTFTTKNDDNVEYTYEGEWKDGVFDGQGTTAWKDSESWVQTGTYKQGKFVPEFYELISSLATWSRMPFTLSDTSYNFLKQHKELFAANSYDAIAPYLDGSVEYKHLAKSPGKYDGTIVAVNCSIQQIFENAVDDEWTKYTYTDLLVCDDNYNYYWAFYPGTCEFYEGDKICVYGLPLGSSSFDNVGGGTTLVQVLAASTLLPR